MQNETAAGLFSRYQDTAVLDTSEQFARWTVASIFPSASTQDTGIRSRVERDFQAKGALLVNNLTSKIMQALFPQSSAFFEIGQTQRMLQLAQEMGADAKAATGLFASWENKASARVFLNAGYSQLSLAIKLLVVTGNALVFRDPQTRRFHTYSVRDYVVKRDGSGTVMSIILKERIALGDLPTAYIESRFPQRDDLCEDVVLYTKVIRKRLSNGRAVYEVTQEIEDEQYGDKPSIYPENLCPYVALTWNLITGEHYGRGLVEDVAGAFARLSALSEASLDYEVEMMKLLRITDGTIAIEDVDNATPGQAIQGKMNVTGNGLVAHEGGDDKKLSAILADIQSIMQELSITFMYTGNTRDAERVTAEEIRTNIAEANQTLGGVYSSLSEVLHVRLAYLLLVEEVPTILPFLNNGELSLDVSVGLSSLNRQATVEKLQYVSNAIQLVLPPLTQASARFNPDLIIDAICEGYGVDRDSLSYTEEQLQAIQEQQQQAAQEAQAAQAAATQPQAQTTNPMQTALNSQQLGLTQ